MVHELGPSPWTSRSTSGGFCAGAPRCHPKWETQLHHVPNWGFLLASLSSVAMRNGVQSPQSPGEAGELGGWNSQKTMELLERWQPEIRREITTWGNGRSQPIIYDGFFFAPSKWWLGMGFLPSINSNHRTVPHWVDLTPLKVGTSTFNHWNSFYRTFWIFGHIKFVSNPHFLLRDLKKKVTLKTSFVLLKPVDSALVTRRRISWDASKIQRWETQTSPRGVTLFLWSGISMVQVVIFFSTYKPPQKSLYIGGFQTKFP